MAKRRRSSRRKKSNTTMYWLIGGGIAAGIFVKFLLPKLQNKVIDPTITFGPIAIKPAGTTSASNALPNAADYSNYTGGISALLNG